MSLRRRSCQSCFKGRRKCDLGYPVCQRCQTYGKYCRYVASNPPDGPTQPITDTVSSTILSTPRRYGQPNTGSVLSFHFDNIEPWQLQELISRSSSIPRLFGNLGELWPVLGHLNWAWTYEEIRSYPISMARNGETVFINSKLYGDSFPRPLRIAFSICTGCLCLNERNQALLFQALDTGVSELLAPPLSSTLLESLVILQAAVLYQIIRMFYGDLEQRVIAERQEYLVRSYALRLLRRMESELESLPPTWETWLLAESTRRTVFVSFKIYTVYSFSRTNICREYEAMNYLPIALKPGLWRSRQAFLQSSDQVGTMPFSDFTDVWSANPQKVVDPFEKLVLMGSLGKQLYEAKISALRVDDLVMEIPMEEVWSRP